MGRFPSWSTLWSRAPIDPPAEPPAGHEDVLSIFIDCFFLPMLEDGRLTDEEFVPLEAAYFGLRVDNEKGFEVVRGKVLNQVDWIRHNPRLKQDAVFCDRLFYAWDRKIDNAWGLPRISQNEREELFKWVTATLSRHNSELYTQVCDREIQKFGGDGSGHSRDEKRYISGHLGKHGIGREKPLHSEKNRVSKLFRDVSSRLKSISDEPADSGKHPTPPVPSPAAGESPGTPHTAAHSASRSSQARTVPAATPSSKHDIPTREATELIPSSNQSAEPSAQSAGREQSPLPAQAEQLPAPPTVIEVSIAELLGDQPVAVADRQAALRRQTRPIIDAVLEHFGDFTSPRQSPLAFSGNRISAKGQVIVVPEAALAEVSAVWFLGDIHGDILGLDSAVRYIDSQSPKATIVLLGDLFDDHGFGYEVVLRVFDLITSRPGRIGYIAGNHDVALNMRPEPECVFSSSVSPSDFADYLNDHGDDPDVGELGKLVVQFLQVAPRAIFFPDGLIAAHAGVPLGIRWEHIKSIADLERDDCLQDFTWTRAHERARKKIPNPTSKTSEFGFEDFSAFCEFVTSSLGIEATSIVRGHDHFEAGYSIYPKWTRNQCVTVNTMSRRLPRDPFGTFHRTPCVARWIPGKPTEVHRLQVPESLIDAYYKPKSSEDDTSAVSVVGSG